MAKTGRATRNDVARMAGVSTAVVSYVLNDGPRPVASTTRKRVLEAMEKLSYRPNAAARALTLHRTNAIGLLVPDISNPFFAEFGRKVQELAFERDYSMILGDTGSDPAREDAEVRSMVDREVDAMLIFGIQDTAPVKLLVDAGIPVVSLDWQLAENLIPTVMVDDYRAARDAVGHLASHGHRRIAFIGGPGDLLVARDRYRGWFDEASLLLEPEELATLAHPAPYTREGGFEVMRDILAAPKRPTAVFVGTDVQAVGALRACHNAGVRVPQDLAVVSFDDTKESQFSVPTLSSVRVPIADLASTALSKVLGEAEQDEFHTLLPHQIILRESCGCVPQTAAQSDN